MLSYKLETDIKKFCWDLVNRKNFGSRVAGFNGNKEKQYTGMLGEVFLYKILNGMLPDFSEFSYTDMVVNNKLVDVKTMGRTVEFRPEFVHNFVAHQADHKNDVYIFTSINKVESTMQICGWIFKRDFFEVADFFDQGQLRTRSDGTSFKTLAPMYEIKNNLLTQINKYEDLNEIGIKTYE